MKNLNRILIGCFLLIALVALGAGIGENILRIGDKTGSDITIEMGDGALKWDDGSATLQFSNDGLSFSGISSGTAGGVGAGINPAELLLEHPNLSNSALVSGLSISSGASNTVEGFTLSPGTGTTLGGIAQYETNIVLYIESIGSGSAGISATDNIDRSASFLNTDIIRVFRNELINGVTERIDTGVKKTLTGNSTHAAGVTSVFFDASTGVEVGDLLIKEDQVTKEVSYVDLGAAPSFNDMILDDRKVISAFDASFLPGLQHQFLMDSLSGTQPSAVSALFITMVGTLTFTPGNHYPNAVTDAISGGQGYGSTVGLSTCDGSGDGLTTFTVNHWFIILGALTSPQDPLGATRATAGANGFILAVTTGAEIDLNLDGIVVTSSGISINDGNWHMVTFTYTSSDANVYLDGNSTPIIVSANPCTAQSNWKPAQTGDFGANSDNLGHLDIRFYNRVLTTAEMATLYNNGAGQVVGNDASLQDTFSLGDQAGQVITSRLRIPSLSGSAVITGTLQGVIKK